MRRKFTWTDACTSRRRPYSTSHWRKFRFARLISVKRPRQQKMDSSPPKNSRKAPPSSNTRRKAAQAANRSAWENRCWTTRARSRDPSVNRPTSLSRTQPSASSSRARAADIATHTTFRTKQSLNTWTLRPLAILAVTYRVYPSCLAYRVAVRTRESLPLRLRGSWT